VLLEQFTQPSPGLAEFPRPQRLAEDAALLADELGPGAAGFVAVQPDHPEGQRLLHALVRDMAEEQ
jgi:hypothetical protein